MIEAFAVQRQRGMNSIILCNDSHNHPSMTIRMEDVHDLQQGRQIECIVQ